jgi:MerR family transcriptional regulator, light-induced transcriptional regulator
MSTTPDLDIPPGHGLFPIRHVCAETGINPVTLRAWERRYGLVQPLRTPKGHRLYSALDIQRIRRILALLEEGVAVSQIAPLLQREFPAPAPDALAPRDLSHWIAEDDPAPELGDPITDALLEAAATLNPVQLDRRYARLVMRHGWEGVHREALPEALAVLRDRARDLPEYEARLAVFTAWAAASFAEQLRAALLLCEGPACPVLLAPAGQRRIEAAVFLLACARQGLRVLPVSEAPSVAALEYLISQLAAPAIVLHSVGGAQAPPPERLRQLFGHAGTPCYLWGPQAQSWSLYQGPRRLEVLPETVLRAADHLGRELLGGWR